MKSFLVLTAGDSNCSAPVNVWEALSGANVLSFKGENCSNSSLNVLNNNLIVTAAQLKPQINYWEFVRKDQQPKRLFTSSPATALTFSQDSVFCAAALNNEIHTWQCCTGDLLSVASGVHRTRILQLKFTWPLTHLVSGDEDGLLAVWHISSLLGGTAESQLHARSHIEPVWSQRISGTNTVFFDVQGVAPRAIVAAASRNGDIMIFDLYNGSVLARSTADGRGIFSLVLSSLSTFVCCGLDQGTVLRVDLASKMDAIGDNSQPEQRIFTYHKEELDGGSEVVCVSMSPDNTLLASGTRSGSVVVINLLSMLPICKIRVDCSRLSNVTIVCRPPHLDDTKTSPQSTVIMPLKRTLTEKSDFMTLVLPCRKRKLYSESELNSLEQSFHKPQDDQESKTSNDEETVADLKMQILALKEQISSGESPPTKSLADLEQEVAQLKSANSQLFKKAVVNILSPK